MSLKVQMKRSKSTTKTLNEPHVFNRLHFSHVGDYHIKNTFSSMSEWDVPTLLKDKRTALPSPEDLVRFGFLPGGKSLEGKCVHFFVDDWRFEKVWTNPDVWAQRFVNESPMTVLTPDFSLYRDWPRSAQLWNTFRSRWCGRLWQEKAKEVGSELRVIPTISWSDKSSYDWCFDGLHSQSVVAISTLGLCRVAATRPIIRELFSAGVLELFDRISPYAVLCYGSEWPYALEEWPLDIRKRIVYYPMVRDIRGNGSKERASKVYAMGEYIEE